MSDAQALVRQTSATHTARLAAALDVALLEYRRRYGDVAFTVTAVRTTDRGVEFTVTAR